MGEDRTETGQKALGTPQNFLRYCVDNVRRASRKHLQREYYRAFLA